MNKNVLAEYPLLKEKKITRYSVAVTGIVQGVGFRPFIYSLAKNNSLRGFVLNNTDGVEIEVEGKAKNIKKFLSRIETFSPPLAVIEKIDYRELFPAGYRSFHIRNSKKEKKKFLPISPDISICSDCLKELFDPNNRRYQYPFINCTNCGPRFTIIEDIPYDRSRTTMKIFPMCPQCESEYQDPLDRRFHAQPNACPTCGPQMSLWDSQQKKIIVADPIKEVARLLQNGHIIAIKGLGGFHLACDATSKKTVAILRSRKYREDKPFALMALNIEMIKEFCEMEEDEENLLLSERRPIVILKKKKCCSLAVDEIAPHNNYLGFMLPYTPLHYLLLEEINLPLVMTSGNISEEPIVYSNEEAFSRLKGLADYFLIHNRDIRMRTDDSVVRIFQKKKFFIRRSRGYAPQPIRVNTFFDEPILALGGQLKNTFCLAQKNQAIISHYIGDLENLSALASFEEGIEHFLKLFHTYPKILACDLHPEYISTKFAQEYIKKLGEGAQLIPVQHHHAHIASLMIEQGIKETLIGVSFDGAGLGSDGNIWGGEFLIANFSSFSRAAHLKEIPLPGGEQAIKEPWRMALSYLRASYGKDFYPPVHKWLKRIDPHKLSLVNTLIEKKINSPLTSSMGRLFDAVASIIGLRDEVNYEGQAAIELEMLAHNQGKGDYPFEIFPRGEELIIDAAPIIRAVIDDLNRGKRRDIIAARFHNSVSSIILKICQSLRERRGLDKVALSGGVFQNIYLLERTFSLLAKAGFETYTHQYVPANDGGISLGQAVIAHYKKNVSIQPCFVNTQ